jgi:hypothetical protein
MSSQTLLMVQLANVFIYLKYYVFSNFFISTIRLSGLLENMSDRKASTFVFATKFVGRMGIQDKFIWVAYGTDVLPPNFDYVEVAWSGLSPENLMPWIRENFGSKAVGCTITCHF